MKKNHNKIEIRRYANNKYYDVCYHFFKCRTPISLKILFRAPQYRELSREINVEMCTIEKIKRNHSERTLSWFSLEPLKINKLCFAHNIIQ